LKSPTIKEQVNVGFDALMYIQDLKIFHNENNLPILIDKFIKDFGAEKELAGYQNKNLVYYRRQLDLIE
jgi:hypothetical protein